MIRYPIAETFSSIQGEGQYCGTLMLFIRLAGCTVGKPFTQDEKAALKVLPTAHHEKCTAWNGQSFICDTNYKMAEKLTIRQIIERITSEPVACITGGEPLMHDLLPLVYGISRIGVRVHFETSGTLPLNLLKGFLFSNEIPHWIAVSPKRNYLEESLAIADEIKILVDKSTFDIVDFIDRFKNYSQKIWFQPVNGEEEINEENLQHCIQLIRSFPNARLSTQAHKSWNVR